MRRQPSRLALATLALALVALAALTGTCIPHPVGPARTFATYQGKAVTTAESALSAVETVRLAAGGAADDHAFGPYIGQVVSEAEEAVGSLQETFGSIQPPDEQADDLRDELDELLTNALGHVTDVRVAARRGQLPRLADVAAPLEADADALRTFAESRKGP
jgi:hypothetical protein